jgi:hypothetical protein
LLAHVGIDEQQKKGGVEELHDEDSVGDQSGLFRLGVLTDVDDQLDDEHTEDEVDSDDTDGHQLVVEETLYNASVEVTAKFLGISAKSLGTLALEEAVGAIETGHGDGLFTSGNLSIELVVLIDSVVVEFLG